MQNTPVVRARICEGLGSWASRWKSRNAGSAEVISPDGASVTVRVIRTDEEMMIWHGDEKHVHAAQAALVHRARCNRAARRGEYDSRMERQ